MKRIIPFFILLLQFFNTSRCIAQNQNEHVIDSALNVLKTSKDDSDKAELLNALSRKFWETGEFEKAKKYGTDALQLAEKLDLKKIEATAYTNIGVTYEDQGNFSEALKDFFEVIRIGKEISDKKSIANGYLECGNIYYYQGNYPEALKNFFADIQIYEEIKDSEGVASGHIAMGMIYYEQGNYTDALQNQLTALKIEEARKDKQAIAGCNINIALIYFQQHDYPAALKRDFAALKIMEEIGDKKSSFDCYLNIGQTYIAQYNYSEALKFSLIALKIAKEIEDKQSIALSYRNLGTIYFELKKFPEAKKYLDDALSLAKGIGSNEEVMSNYQTLAMLDSAVGNYKQSLEDYKLYTIYKDTLFNEKNNKQIEEIKTKYETEKKDNEITLLTKDKEIQNIEIKRQKFIKNSLIGGLAALLILSILFYNYYRTKQLLKLQTLRNRIASDLHDDVGSTLSSISIFSELAKEQSKEVIPMLESIGDSSRKMLDSMADIVWTINPENDNFEKIILRMRSFAYELLGAKKIDFEFNADDTVAKLKLPMDVRKNLYLIFKEAINNMVKYADADRAFFSINGTKNNLTMLIRDNGKGFDTNKLSEGNGLKNMKKRAQEIGAKLLIESGAGAGTTIQFLLKTA